MPNSSRPLRIAVVHNLKAGGAARRLAGTVGELRERDVELREFSLRGRAVQLLEQPERVAYRRRAPELPTALRPPARYVDHRALLLAWTRVSMRVNAWQPDVVFANPCSELVGAPPTLDMIDAPVVYYCDEARRVDYEPDTAQTRRSATRLIYRRLHDRERCADRRGLHAAAAVLTNSDYSAQRIEAAYGTGALVAAPGVHDTFARQHDAVIEHVLSVGSLIPTKGHDLVIRAAALAGVGLPVVVVGPREMPDEQQRLTAIAHDAGVQLTFRIGVDDAALASLYAQALATVYLAHNEPLGLVSLESQACGTPVVVADEGGLGSTVEQSRSGLRVARTAEAAAEALREIASPDVRAAMVEHLRWVRPRREAQAADDVLSTLRKAAAGARRPVRSEIPA